MNDLIKDEDGDWISKKELMSNLQISSDTIEQIINDLNSRRPADTQNHIKKGGYHNSETYYDDYLVKLIQAKLLSNQTNQGNSSDTIKSILKSAVKNELTKTLKTIQAWLLSNQANQGKTSDTIKADGKNEDYIYSAKEIWELCNSSSRTWDRFVAEFLSVIGEAQKKYYVEEHPSRSGGNRYTEKTLKTFQAWLLSNQANQGRASDTIKSAVKNELTKTLKTFQAWLLSNQANQGRASDTIKSIVKTAVKNEETKTQIEQSKAQIEQRLRTEQTKSITETKITVGKEKITILNW